MTMKKSIIIICLLGISLCTYSTEIFLPRYCTSIVAENEELLINDSSLLNELFVSAPDERFSILVMHDTITDERIQRIKDIRGLSILYSLLGVLTITTTAHALFAVPLTPLTNIYDFALVASSAHLAHTSFWASSFIAAQAEKVKKMPITIFIQNNTDEEICVNDMNRGLTWYIRAHKQLALSVGNPEINSFRISELNPVNQKVGYVSIAACNYIQSYNYEFEDQVYYYLDWKETFIKSDEIATAIRINKNTALIDTISWPIKEAKKIKKSLKK